MSIEGYNDEASYDPEPRTNPSIEAQAEVDRLSDELAANHQRLRAATQPDGDRGAASLGNLNAHGLVALRAIILRVIDDGPSGRERWYFYEDWVTPEAEANDNRLDFCDAIAAEIVRLASPATTGGRGK